MLTGNHRIAMPKLLNICDEAAVAAALRDQAKVTFLQTGAVDLAIRL
jgi:hypothetical protein